MIRQLFTSQKKHKFPHKVIAVIVKYVISTYRIFCFKRLVDCVELRQGHCHSGDVNFTAKREVAIIRGNRHDISFMLIF
jgi:hypothetical protein